jgi:septal ring factor EnvC (AmiA/AmiB activator)
MIFSFSKMAASSQSIELHIAELEREIDRFYREISRIDSEIDGANRRIQSEATKEKAKKCLVEMHLLADSGRTDSGEYRHYKERRAELLERFYRQHLLDSRKTFVERIHFFND